MNSVTTPQTGLAGSLPFVGADWARQALQDHFGLKANVVRLSGERELNFQATTGDGTHSILKVAPVDEGRETLDMQTAALAFLARVAPELPVPRVLPARDGSTIVSAEAEGVPVHLRVQSYLAGTPQLGIPATVALRRGVGLLAARLNRALASFFHPAAGRTLAWDLRNAAALRPWIAHLASDAQRATAVAVLDGFDKRVAPVLDSLPCQVIHADINQNNLLVDDGGVALSGLLDFGDMVHSQRVNELAVAVAHQLYRQDDPVSAACDVISAYALELQPTPQEVEVLLDLVKTRLLSREIIAAWRAATHPGAAHYDPEVSALGWAALERLAGLDADATTERFLAAAGLPGRRAGTIDAATYDAHMASLLTRRNQLLGPMYKTFYNEPFNPVKGEGVWVTDARGRVYLDGYNNVPHVGHCHPHVVAAGTRQLRLLNTHTRYLHDTVLQYAEKLSSTLPDPINVCLFVCSGTEANELAWRIACANTDGDGAIITRSAFHGNSTIIAELDSSTLPHDKLKPWVATVPAPEMAGHRPDRSFQDAEAYAAHYTAAIDQLQSRGHKPAAFFTCSVFASDGLYSPPPGYLDPAMARLRKAGALVIADEVQSGLGRPGTHMWGFEHAGFTPDIVTMGKPMGNGLPLAVVVTRRELLERFIEKGRYFNTFGGNPVVCAAGLAVLEVVEREGLQRNALEVGAYLRAGLAGLMSQHERIADVRGSGLFLGVEMVEDRATNAPSQRLARAVIEGLLARGVLVGTTGLQRNLLKIRPPMVFSKANADQLVATLDETLTALRDFR